MSKSDVEVKSLLMNWIVPVTTIAVIVLLIKKYGSVVRDRLFAGFWSRMYCQYHSALREIKKVHFQSIHDHKSADPDLNNRGLIRILEIGAGPGANFEFYPPNSKLSVVEPNVFFEPIFYECQSKYPAIKMEKFYVATAEDMKDVSDNSIDVVVSTLVLCSVKSVEQTAKEVARILAPGGKFYYWEHVHDTPGTWLNWIQTVLTYTVHDVVFGCRLDRNIDSIIESSGEFSRIEQKRFDIPLQTGLWKMIRPHVMGIATK